MESDIYRVQYNRLYDPLLWSDSFEYFDIFYKNIGKAIEEKKGTILKIYNSSLAICTGHFYELLIKWRRNPASCFYFYNSDEDLASVCPEFTNSLVAESNVIYNEITQYPHIRKIEVLVVFKLSFQSLAKINKMVTSTT